VNFLSHACIFMFPAAFMTC